MLAALFSGCSKKEFADPLIEATASLPATYAEINFVPSTNISRARPFPSTNIAWQSAPLAIVQTELSPATLIHCESQRLSLFARMQERGLGAPSHAVFGANGGPRMATNGLPIDVSQMNECWILVWFAGAKNWTNWDSPWAVFVQHRPNAMKLDQDGLHFAFSGPAGDLVMMPLYGNSQLPTKGVDSPTKPSPDKQKKIKTGEWAEVLPREPLMRLRYWAGATREFPLHCEDSFSVDRGRGTVIVRQRFHWHSIRDDWATKAMKVAPISPALALAALDGKYSVRLSGQIFDFELPTRFGPYAGIQNVGNYDVTLPILRYINLTEAPHPLPLTNRHPSVTAALDRLQRIVSEAFGNGPTSGSRMALSDVQWFAQALPYLDGATRVSAIQGLSKSIRRLDSLTNRLDAKSLEALWAYAHFAGDWNFVKEHWPLLKSWFAGSMSGSWSDFGRRADEEEELSDGTLPSAAMARLAYAVGDFETYHDACLLVAQESVRHFGKKRVLAESSEAPVLVGLVGIVSNCLATIRASQPTRWERLIPGGSPTPFIAAMEREPRLPLRALTHEVNGRPRSKSGVGSAIDWPELIWPVRQSQERSFGFNIPGPNVSCSRMETNRLDGTTQVISLFR